MVSSCSLSVFSDPTRLLVFIVSFPELKPGPIFSSPTLFSFIESASSSFSVFNSRAGNKTPAEYLCLGDSSIFSISSFIGKSGPTSSRQS